MKYENIQSFYLLRTSAVSRDMQRQVHVFSPALVALIYANISAACQALFDIPAGSGTPICIPDHRKKGGVMMISGSMSAYTETTQPHPLGPITHYAHALSDSENEC